METTAIIANGHINSYPTTRSLIVTHTRVVAVDGGLRHCDEMGIQPTSIVGDFDSCSDELLSRFRDVPKITLKKEKDETDLETAIASELNEKITLFGAWGGRIDHSLVNALIVTRFPRRVQLETEDEILFAIDKKITLECFVGQTLSLIPICGPVLGIVTKGLKWELQGGKMDLNFVGVSNICLTSGVEISVEKGVLLCSLIKKSSS